MDWIRLARALGGLLSIIVLLILVLANTPYWYPNRVGQVTPKTIALLLFLIGGLLGVDRFLEGRVLSIQWGENDDGNGD